MKAVILAGGLGTRLAEETELRPKPMVEIGGRPLLWHIMKIYSHFGIDEFVICLGYKGYYIKEYFLNYYMHTADLTLDLTKGTQSLTNSKAEPWKIHLIETGLHTQTGGRIMRIRHMVDDETFCLTYGDGVADVDLGKLLKAHRRHVQSGAAATVTAVQPPGRFGVLKLGAAGAVAAFEEKPSDEIGWINGGFFVLEPSVFDHIDGDGDSWERKPLERLAAAGKLYAFQHSGFWKPCDTLRDKQQLEALWQSGAAPWKIWS